MSRSKPIELTNICLVYQGDRLLVQEREWRGSKGIIFPGGHVEEGESLLDAVIREVKEETGLTIEGPIPCGFKDWFEDDGTRYMVLLYKTDRFTGELASSEEGRVFWVTREEFHQMNTIWEMDKLLKIMDSDSYSELFYDDDHDDGILLG